MFVIEDELHADHCGEFGTHEEAIAELRRRATVPWDEEPNVAPCAAWEKCGRRYELVEYDTSVAPWREVRRRRVLEISKSGVIWHEEPPAEKNA